MMKKLLLTGIAALFLATGATQTPAHENKRVELMLFKCGGHEVTLWEEVYPSGFGRSIVLELPTRGKQVREHPGEPEPEHYSWTFNWGEKAELTYDGVKCEVMWPAEEG